MRRYYCAKWPGDAAPPVGTALQRGEARSTRPGITIAWGSVEEAMELALVVVMEVLPDHQYLRDGRRRHSQSRGSAGGHLSGLGAIIRASTPL